MTDENKQTITLHDMVRAAIDNFCADGLIHVDTECGCSKNNLFLDIECPCEGCELACTYDCECGHKTFFQLKYKEDKELVCANCGKHIG